MKNTILSLFTIILFSCDFQDSPVGHVDPKLKPYLEDFKREAAVRGINFETSFSIHFGNLREKNVRALTVYSSHEIIIDSASTDYNPFVLLAHEIGHTIGRGHCDETIIMPDGKQRLKSIMTTGYLYYFEQYRKYYLDELFNYHSMK